MYVDVYATLYEVSHAAHTHIVRNQPPPPRRHGTSKSIYFACGSEVLGGVGESSVVDAGGVTGRRRGAALCGISSGSLQQPRNEL